VVAGFLLSFVLSRYAEAPLYGVTGADPKTWIVVAVVLSAAVLAASVVPAWRASRIDPATALRSE
jgi:ABC-type antimicrobial peptide transport system permease subunit